FTPATVTIQGSLELAKQVRKALHVKKNELTYIPPLEHERELAGEWVDFVDHAADLEDDPNSPIILYLHGGAHIFMSPNSHRFITSEAARNCKARVFAVDYRLAPEAPFPSAVEDAVACYLALVQPLALPKMKATVGNAKVVSNHRVFLMGDSSGSSLVLQTLQVLKALDLPMPAGCVMLSPFLDHTMAGQSWHTNWNSDFLSLDMHGVKWAMEMYTNGLEPHHPSCTPLNGDLSNLCPILIQSGDSEVVMDDAILFHQRASSAGNQIQLQLYKDMFHVFHTFPHLPQSAFALKRAGVFIRSQVAEATRSDSGVSLVTDVDEAVLESTIYLIDVNDQELPFH
ncbi:hypothetical protein HDU91_003951, partial [Kappamyces sp. JEL0680]